MIFDLWVVGVEWCGGIKFAVFPDDFDAAERFARNALSVLQGRDPIVKIWNLWER